MADYESSYTGAQVDSGVGYGISFGTHKMAATTAAIFYQDTAPSQWTIDATVDDKLLFITKGSGAGGETGGGEHASGTWEVGGVSGDSHTLTSDEIPSHRHQVGNCTATQDEMYGCGGMCGTGSGTASYSSYTGGGGGHTHDISSDSSWRPAAYCAIICTKDAY